MAAKKQPSSATKCMAKLLVLMLLLSWKAEATKPVTCTAVTTRYNTTVVCDFGLDISESQHGFNVQFYDPDNTAEAKTVLACNFIEGGDLVCAEGSDIKFNKNQVSDQIQITGPPAVDKVGGRYVCQLAPAEGSIETCDLKYKDIPKEPLTTSKIHTPGNDSIDSTSLIVNLLKIIVGLLIAILVFMIVVYIIRGVLYCKRERDRGSGSTRSPQGDIEASGSNGSRDARNKRTLSFFQSWCRRWRKDEPQEQESVPLTDQTATDPQKEQRNKRDKGDPDLEAIPMGSAIVGYPMLQEPPTSTYKESPEQEQQYPDRAQSGAKPKQGGGTGFPLGIITGKGKKQDPETEQRKKTGKEDPDEKANQMESASAREPLLSRPPTSTNEGRQFLVPSGAVALRQVDTSSTDFSLNEEPAEERPEGKKKTGLMGRLKLAIKKKKGDEDQQQKVPKAEPQEEKKEAT